MIQPARERANRELQTHSAMASQRAFKFLLRILAHPLRLLLQHCPMPILLAVAPRLRLEFLLSLIKPFCSLGPGHYNKALAVPNVEAFRTRWLYECDDRQPGDPVVLFSHGGAYMMGLMPGFCILWTLVLEKLGNSRLSVLMLDYSLVQEALFPRQLEEITLVYNELVKSCDNIVLAGDSAGGHLTLSLLRHGEFPVEGVTCRVGQVPCGLILLSPWLNLHPQDGENDGYVRNKNRDLLSGAYLRKCTQRLINDPQMYRSHTLSFCKDTETDWHSLLPNKVLITLSEYEIFHDDILQFAQLARVPSDSLFFDSGATHDSGVLVPWFSPVPTAILQYLESIDSLQ